MDLAKDLEGSRIMWAITSAGSVYLSSFAHLRPEQSSSILSHEVLKDYLVHPTMSSSPDVQRNRS